MAVQISGNDITVPRDGTFTRNVTIGGTLTYEDVTNIDSVGLVTARTGIEIGARPGVAASISVDGNMIVSGITTIGGVVNASSDIKVGSGVTVGKDGDIFATGVTTSTTFVGALTGTASGNTTITNNADNRVVTGGSGNALNGESDLTFDGTTVKILNTVPKIELNDGSSRILQVRGGSTSHNPSIVTQYASELYLGANNTESVNIGTEHLTITNGDLVIGTAGHGIDFSAQTATSASGSSTSSELLDHYEEGTWTPVYVSTNSTISYDTQTGYFTRVGNTVTVTAYIRTSSVSSTGHSLVKVSGLPFAEGKNQRTPGSVRCNGFQGTATDFGYPVTWSVEAGQTFGELQRYQSGGNGDFTTSTMNNATFVYLQCTYQTA